MKLYLSSIRIPTPGDLASLLGKPLAQTSVALIPNAKDYYNDKIRKLKIDSLVRYMESLGLSVQEVDLRGFHDSATLGEALAGHDLIWAMGGNTFMLRYEMQRSGFDDVIQELLNHGVVYGGDSAGALVAGISIAGIESADEPEFAESVIQEDLNLVPYVILPHLDNPEFTEAVAAVNQLNTGVHEVIALKDSQAVLVDGDKHWLTESAVQ